MTVIVVVLVQVAEPVDIQVTVEPEVEQLLVVALQV
jgi:hypothetical protein